MACETFEYTDSFTCEYGVALIDSYVFINAFCIVRENLGLQGKNVYHKRYQYRYMLLEQAADWARRCMSNGFERKKRLGSLNLVRSYVIFSELP